jgi:hypothetical protein
MPPGSPNIFKPELGRNLNKVFPPPYGGFEVPQILGGVVTLTHDFPGTAPYLGMSIYDASGANDVIQLLAIVVPPDGFIWIVDEMSVYCSDPVSRDMSLRLRYNTSLGVFVVTVFRVTTSTSPLPYPVGRRLIVPPGGIFDLSVPVIGAGQNLRWTLSYLQVPAGQFVPKS